MKKLKLIFIFALLLLFLTTGFSFASAQESPLDEELESQIKGLQIEGLENFFQELDGGSFGFGNSIYELITKINAGEIVGVNAFIDALIQGINQAVSEDLSLYIFIIGLCFVSSISSAFVSDFSSDSVKNAVKMLSYAAITAIVLSVIVRSVKVVITTLDSMGTFIEIIFPILLTVIVALGGVTSAAVIQPTVVALTTLVFGIITSVVVPLFVVTVIFTAISRLTTQIKLDKLAKTTLKSAEWLLGAVFSIFFTVVTAQGLVGSTGDSVRIKSAKFALSSYVPVLGGYLSDGFDIVVASGILIKNALGIIGLLIIFVIVLVPIVKLAVLSLFLRLAGAIAEPLGENNMSQMLFMMGKNLTLLIAVICGVAFLCATIFILIIITCNVGVV